MVNNLAAFMKHLEDKKKKEAEPEPPPTVKEVMAELNEEDLTTLVLAAADRLDYLVHVAKKQDDRSPATMERLVGLYRVVHRFDACVN